MFHISFLQEFVFIVFVFFFYKSTGLWLTGRKESRLFITDN